MAGLSGSADDTKLLALLPHGRGSATRSARVHAASALGWQIFLGGTDVLATSKPGEPGTFLQPNRRPRWRAIALTLAVELALLLIVWLTPSFRKIVQHPASVLKTFEFPEPEAGGAPKAAQPKQRQEQRAAAQIPPPVIPPPPIVPKTQPPNPIWMSSSDFAASDISKLGGGKGGSSGGKATGYGPPDGKGSQFARADWYREPTRGELAAYLPSITEDSWAVIVCKT
ncbi:MAG TPA: hypothetical protein VL405_05915, partial [Sphingomonas sp.]|nr:hypothetical protein [Sphingomonas sp.]